MNDKGLQLEARLATIEYMVQRLYSFTYKSHGLSSDEIKVAHENMREMVRTESFPTKDPAKAALAQGLVEDAFQDFLASLESMLKDLGLLEK